MGVENELGGSIPLPAAVVGGIVVALLGGGAGLGSYLGPRVDAQALHQCSTNSQLAIEIAKTSLGVAEDHSKEIIDTNDRVKILRAYIERRTQDRYTAQDASRRKTLQAELDSSQDRHRRELDRRLESLERKVGEM